MRSTMRYSEWNPAIHTMADDPEICLTYAFNVHFKGKGRHTRIRRIYMNSDAFQAFEEATQKRMKAEGKWPNGTILSGFLTTIHNTGEPGWGFCFESK